MSNKHRLYRRTIFCDIHIQFQIELKYSNLILYANKEKEKKKTLPFKILHNPYRETKCIFLTARFYLPF